MNRLNLREFEKIFGPPCRNQVTVLMPVVGRFTCHDKLVPQFRGMFQEIEDKKLGDLIRHDGCFNCRKAKLIDGGYSIVWSRHAFGAAEDNWSDKYPYGSTKQQPQALLEIYNKWGFFIPVFRDPMHAEFYQFVKGGNMPLHQLQSVAAAKVDWGTHWCEWLQARLWYPGGAYADANFRIPFTGFSGQPVVQVTPASGKNDWLSCKTKEESASGVTVYVRDYGKTNLADGALHVTASYVYPK